MEYILLLVITVGLVLMFSKRFYRPYGDYLNSYMGGYLACLLDKGVLPKLGSGDDSCADSLKLAGDNPFKPKIGAKSDSSADKGPARPPARPSEMNEMASSRGGAAGGKVMGRPPSTHTYADPKSSDGGVKDDKVTSVPNPLAESKYYKVSRYGSAGHGKQHMIQLNGLAGLLDSERERLKRREERTSRAGVVETDESIGKGKRMVIKPPERKLATEVEAEPMTFGRFVRMLIIIAILLAIVVFLGGQANQISKSWEK